MPTGTTPPIQNRSNKCKPTQDSPTQDGPIEDYTGQAALPVALLALFMLICIGLIARWGQAALMSSRAQAAADSAALATLIAADPVDLGRGVLPDDALARSAAGAGRGKLAGFQAEIASGMVAVEVVVDMDGQLASAAAAVSLPQKATATGPLAD